MASDNYIRYAAISASSSGNNTLVAATTGRRIRVLGYTLVCTSAVGVRFESAADGTALTGVMPFGANGGVANAYNPLGLFETVAGELLNLELSGAVLVAGHLTYALILPASGDNVIA